MRKIDLLDDYWLKISIDDLIALGESDSGYRHDLSGSILHNHPDSGKESQVGIVKARLFNLWMMVNDGISLYDEFDSVNDMVMEYYSAFFDRHGNFKEEFHDEYGGVPISMLTIDKLEIAKNHRGNFLGLSVMSSLIRSFALGESIVAIKPCPLQFSGGRKPSAEEKKWDSFVDYRTFSKDREVALKKLVSHYEKLGFKRIGSTEIYGLATMNQVPKIKEIVLAAK